MAKELAKQKDIRDRQRVAEITVYDEETKDFVQVSKEIQSIAGAIHKQISMSSIATALLLKKMKDEKLYLGLDCQSFNEYVQCMLPFKERMARNYIRIAERFQKFLPETVVIGDRQRVAEIPENLQSLSLRSLVQLTNIDDDDFDEVTSKDNLGQPTPEFAKMLQEVKKKHSGKISQLTEEVKKLKAENESSESVAEREKRNEEIERIYGAKASTLKSKRMLMDAARSCLNQAEQYLHQINVDDEDPAGLKKDMADLISRFHAAFKKGLNNYLFLADQIEEYD